MTKIPSAPIVLLVHVMLFAPVVLPVPAMVLASDMLLAPAVLLGHTVLLSTLYYSGTPYCSRLPYGLYSLYEEPRANRLDEGEAIVYHHVFFFSYTIFWTQQGLGV